MDRGGLSGNRPKSASGKSSSCRFSFSAERNANVKKTVNCCSVYEVLMVKITFSEYM